MNDERQHRQRLGKGQYNANTAVNYTIYAVAAVGFFLNIENIL